MKLTIKFVSKKDYRFLYVLLKQRKSEECISHETIPTYKKHLSFCEFNPYSEWYIVYYKDKKVGSLYITKRWELGIHFLNKYNFLTKKVLDNLGILPKYANVSPKNKELQKILTSLGYKIIQYTYEKNTD